MGVLIQVRDVDESVRAVLKGRAARAGVSLNTFLQRVLEREARTPSRDEVLARISARSEVAKVSSVDIIRAGRER
ncbi:MAG: hypothetical protein Q4G43_11600 [Mobilicoccus sp.]|nr:hypothetical protein [Mobilicoccus sp.]